MAGEATAAGGAIGTAVPGIGTAIGAGIGAIIDSGFFEKVKLWKGKTVKNTYVETDAIADPLAQVIADQIVRTVGAAKGNDLVSRVLGGNAVNYLNAQITAGHWATEARNAISAIDNRVHLRAPLDAKWICLDIARFVLRSYDTTRPEEARVFLIDAFSHSIAAAERELGYSIFGADISEAVKSAAIPTKNGSTPAATPAKTPAAATAAETAATGKTVAIAGFGILIAGFLLFTRKK